MPVIRQQQRLPSAASLKKFTQKGVKENFLSFLAFRDTAFYIDDFLGDTIDLNYYALADSGGTAKADFATLVSQGTGYVQGSTGTDSGGSISLISPIVYRGDNSAGMWIRFRIDDVTNVQFEVGFIDGVPGSNASGVTDVDTPTAAFANGAVVQMDTAQTLTTMAFVTKGSASNQTIKATTLTGTTTPTNAAFMDVAIQLGPGGSAQCFVNGGQPQVYDTGRTGNNAGGFVNNAVSLGVWVYVKTNTTAARKMDIDAIATWTNRV